MQMHAMLQQVARIRRRAMSLQIFGARTYPSLIWRQRPRDPRRVPYRAHMDDRIGIAPVRPRRLAQIQFELQLRMQRGKPRQDGRHMMPPITERGRNAQRAGQTFVLASKRLGQRVELCKQRRPLAGETLAFGRQRQLPRSSRGQRQPQRRLELAKPRRQCRGRDVEHPGGRAERRRLRQRLDQTQVLDLNHSPELNVGCRFI